MPRTPDPGALDYDLRGDHVTANCSSVTLIVGHGHNGGGRSCGPREIFCAYGDDVLPAVEISPLARGLKQNSEQISPSRSQGDRAARLNGAIRIVALQMRNHPETLPHLMVRLAADLKLQPAMEHYRGKLLVVEVDRIRIRE